MYLHICEFENKSGYLASFEIRFSSCYGADLSFSFVMNTESGIYVMCILYRYNLLMSWQVFTKFRSFLDFQNVAAVHLNNKASLVMLCASFVILLLSLICEVGNKPHYLASFRIKLRFWVLKVLFFLLFWIQIADFAYVYLL